METGYNDEELWKAFQKGDDAAFALMYRLHIRALYRYGHKITSNTDLIEDAIQDVFADLWNSREKLSSTDSIRYYLFRVLRRKIGKNLLYQQVSEPLDSESAQRAPVAASYENELIQAEALLDRNRHLENALLRLPARQREAISLRYYHGFTHSNVSEIMGISLQSVHNLLQKSMKSLRELLVENPDLFLVFVFFAH